MGERVALGSAAFGTALLVLVAITQSAPSHAAGPTYVGGTVSTPTSWLAANSPYIAYQTITVTQAATLTVEPGTVVRFANRAGLHVDGSLQAVGTPERPVSFVSYEDKPWAGSWEGIRLACASECTIRYAVIRDANIGVDIQRGAPTLSDSMVLNTYIAVRISAGSPLISGNRLVAENTVVDALTYRVVRVTLTRNLIAHEVRRQRGKFTAHGDGPGLSIQAPIHGDSQFIVEQNTIIRNYPGVQVGGGAGALRLKLQRNNMHSNSDRDLDWPRCEDGDVSFNYWGTTHPVEIARRIRSECRAQITFVPFLLAPERAAPVPWEVYVPRLLLGVGR